MAPAETEAMLLLPNFRNKIWPVATGSEKVM